MSDEEFRARLKAVRSAFGTGEMDAADVSMPGLLWETARRVRRGLPHLDVAANAAPPAYRRATSERDVRQASRYRAILSAPARSNPNAARIDRFYAEVQVQSW